MKLKVVKDLGKLIDADNYDGNIPQFVLDIRGNIEIGDFSTEWANKLGFLGDMADGLKTIEYGAHTFFIVINKDNKFKFISGLTIEMINNPLDPEIDMEKQKGSGTLTAKVIQIDEVEVA